MTTMSQAELRKELKRTLGDSQPGRTLYNGFVDDISFSYNGKTFTIPAKGRLVVHDLYEVDPERVQAARKGRRPMPQDTDMLIGTADQVTEHAIVSLRGSGVVWLPGRSAEEDTRIRAAADAAGEQFRFKQAMSIVARYRDRTDAFRRNPANAGMPVSPMDDREQAAQDYLDDVRLGKLQHRAHICKYNCGAEYDDEARLERHYQASHPLHQGGVGHPEDSATPKVRRRRRANTDPADPERAA